MARAAFWGRTKAIVQALAWIAGFLVVGGGVMVGLAKGLGLPGDAAWVLAVSSAYGVAGFGFATWLVGRVADKHPWAALGWGEPRRLAARLGTGVAMGAGMALVAVLAGVGAGARLARDAGPGPFEPLVPLAVGLVLAALLEELVFRGYPLRRLADATEPRIAVGLFAVGFGVAHAWNPAVTALGLVNIGLAAVWLSFAFFSPGGMPLAWGLHVGWNAGLGLLFDAPVSGLRLHVPAVEYVPGQRAWLDGGAFGPEGGLVGTVVLIAGILAVLGRRFRQPRAWLVS
jgi:hypothetical protein